jgi:hypothetical protein
MMDQGTSEGDMFVLGGLEQKNVSAQKTKSSTPRRSVVLIKRAGQWRRPTKHVHWWSGVVEKYVPEPTRNRNLTCHAMRPG